MTPPERIVRWRVPVVCVALAAITFAVFGPTLWHEFVDYDDNDYVYDNPIVALGLTLKGFIWAFSFHCFNWHPLTWLSHMLDCQLYGLHPGGHHFTNVLLHAATVITLFLVLRKMTGAFWRSAFVAAVFAIHPLRVESVAWVAERKDVLSGLLFMMTVVAYVRYARRPVSPFRYGLVLVSYAAGLMCKPMLVTLPLVLLLLDYWPLQRAEPARKLVLEKLPLLAMSLASCITAVVAERHGIRSTGSFSAPNRLANALVTCTVYLRQMVWPKDLVVLYPFPQDGLAPGEVSLAVILLVVLSTFAWSGRRTQPWLLVGWVWYLVMLLPVLGLVQVGAQAHADRYTYLPQIGVYVAVTWLVAEWRWSRLAVASLMTTALAALMICASRQTRFWQDSESLWTHAVACTRSNCISQCNLGAVLCNEGHMDQGIAHLQTALKINPGQPEAHNNLGFALCSEGHLDEGIAEYVAALQFRPAYSRAHYNLAVALQLKGRPDEAITQFGMALQINPDNADARENLGVVLQQQGRPAEAISQYQEALQLDPVNSKVQNNLAWVLATSTNASLRDGSQAVKLASQANELSGGTNPGILDTLAAAFAEAGRFDEAIRTAQKAQDLARAAGKRDLVEELNGELKLYQAGHPIRQ
jgi:protein O-mannosyl-transferase